MKMDLEKIVEYLMNLMAFDTTCDTKNELPCARYVEEELRKYGIKTKLFVSKQNRASVAAWIEGKEKSTLVLHGHLDTAEYGEGVGWKFPADKPSRIHHCICGRGALDCKSQVAVWMKILTDLKQSGRPLERSVLFLATADEENGGKEGLSFVLDQMKGLKDAFLVLGEGGGFPFPFEEKWMYTVQTGERTDQWNEEKKEDDPMNILEEGIRKGYYSENLIPYFSYGKTAQGRRLDLEPLYFGMKKIFATMEKSDVFSRYEEVLLRALKSHRPKAELMAVITPGYSDNRYFRALRIPTLGFFPLDERNGLFGIHGKNEYISEASLRLAYEVLQQVVYEFVLTK